MMIFDFTILTRCCLIPKALCELDMGYLISSAEGGLTINQSNRKAFEPEMQLGLYYPRPSSLHLVWYCPRVALTAITAFLTDTWHPNNVRVILTI